MKLNRFNYEHEEENIKKQEEIKNKKRKKKEKAKKIVKKEEEEEEENEGEEEEDEKKEEKEENEEEIENEDYDNNKKAMINKGEKEPKKKIFKKLKAGGCKIISLVLGILFILFALIILIGRKRKKKIIEFGLFGKTSNETEYSFKNSLEANINNEQLNQIKNDLTNIYNSGEINIIKFYEENINKKQYTPPDTSNLKSIHIAIGLSENDIDTIIRHLASAVQHSAQTSFLHIHIMDADTFGFESLIKLKNLIYKINNNTEIIIYNASNELKSFTIREGFITKFAKDYAKLYALKAIKNVQRVIFLDGDDCMVQKDLFDLYSLEMNDIYVRGISEVPSIKNPVDWMDKYLFDKSHYINGGVILVNLELCKNEGIYEKAKELNNQEFYTKTEEPFQDIINILMRRKIEFFHPKYNKINFYETPEDKGNEQKWYPWVIETLKQSEKNNHIYTKLELMEADNDPVIIHYAWEKQLNKTVKKYEDDKKAYGQIVGLP